MLERQCARVVVLCQELNQPCWNMVSQSNCFVADTVIHAGTAASQSGCLIASELQISLQIHGQIKIFL